MIWADVGPWGTLVSMPAHDILQVFAIQEFPETVVIERWEIGPAWALQTEDVWTVESVTAARRRLTDAGLLPVPEYVPPGACAATVESWA